MSQLRSPRTSDGRQSTRRSFQSDPKSPQFSHMLTSPHPSFDMKTPILSSTDFSLLKTPNIGAIPASPGVNLRSIRRSPRIGAKTGLGTTFSPTAFWRSPVVRDASTQRSLADNPLMIPPAYSPSLGFVRDTNDASPMLRALLHSNNPSNRSRSMSEPEGTRYLYDFGQGDSEDPSDEVKRAASSKDEHQKESVFDSISPTEEPVERKKKSSKRSKRHRESQSVFDEDIDGTGSSCHQCKSRRHQDHLSFCQHTRSKKDSKPRRVCRKKYCEICLKKFYKEDPPEFDEDWLCPACRDLCTCAACRRSRNKSDSVSDDNDMDPETYVAVGLVHFRDKLRNEKMYRLENLPKRLRIRAKEAALRFIALYEHHKHYLLG